jgi:GTP-binding protein
MLALVGRPNVGKSSLFNRIVGESRALVEATPGVTRDRLISQADWAGKAFTLVDTGGLAGDPSDPFAPATAAQAEAAIAEAACVLLVVDAAAGLAAGDWEIAQRLRRSGKPVVVVANKCDRRGADPAEFYALGLGTPFPVSAARGEGLGDVLDAALADVAAQGDAPEAAESLRVAVVGRPNVGKSSLVNRLLGAERLIVSPLAGTTRDAIDVPCTVDGHSFTLVDTPGLRRPGRIAERLEAGSAQRSRRAIARADVAALVLDAQEPCTDQDKRIAGIALDRRVGLVLVANKADLLPPGGLATVRQRVRTEMPFLAYAPVVGCSAASGQGIADVAAAVARAGEAVRFRMPTPALNDCLRAAIAARPPAAHQGKPVRIYYAAQLRTAPPTVVLLTNAAHAVTREYARYLENQLRQRFPLEGAPLRFVFRVRPHRRLVPAAPQPPGGRRPEAAPGRRGGPGPGSAR